VPMFIDMRKRNLNGAKEEVMAVPQVQNTIIFLNQIIKGFYLGNYIYSFISSLRFSKS